MSRSGPRPRTGTSRSSRPAPAPAAIGLALALAGCDWVDSTGAQPGDAPAAPGTVAGPSAGPEAAPVTEFRLDEIRPGDAVALLEGAAVRVAVPAADALDADGAPLEFSWEAVPLAEGALESCAGLDGFDPARAPATLAEACTDPDACALAFTGIGPGEDEAAAFELAVPALRSPIGTRRALVGTRRDEPGQVPGDGGATAQAFRRELDLCLIAVNEAPDARDDEYALVEGGALEVDAADGVLANDVDDVDTANAPLSVSPVPLRAPERAERFELRPDGGFTYVPLADDGGAVLDDGFEYEASDGVQVSSASVTLLAPTGNRPPEPVDDPPPVVARVGAFLFVDLSNRFADPDGDPLSFSFVEPLPDDGSLALSPDGTLSGVPGEGDVGEYPLTLVADDGEGAAAAPLLLVVEEDAVPAEDAAPSPAPPPGPAFVPGSTFDQSVRLGGVLAPVRPAFDGGEPPLRFASGGAAPPFGVVVDPATGTVAGRPRQRGPFPGLVVTATDANGARASSAPFSIEVR